MKKPPIFDKILFFLNSIVATLLLLSFLASFISPQTIAFLSVFSLLVPSLMILNLVFFTYWLIKLKKQLFLSAFVLAIGGFYLPPFYKFFKKEIILNDDIKVMSYNVRNFNYHKWNKKDPNTAQKIFDFIAKKSPDILLVQEFYPLPKLGIYYPYQYKKLITNKTTIGLVIYSKYSIINSGSLDFKNTSNNAIFADIVRKKDTIRIYNIHLESLRINLNKERFGQGTSERLFDRVKNTFVKQASETKQLLAHERRWKGKKIIGGDFNNTAYSWVYNQIAKGKKDAFIRAGLGLGKSYNYFFPMRIDFILTDKTAKINYYKTFKVAYSDHFPILTRLTY